MTIQSVKIPCTLDVVFDAEYCCYVIGGERQNNLYIYEWNSPQVKEYELPYKDYHFQRLENIEGEKVRIVCTKLNRMSKERPDRIFQFEKK